MDCHMSPRVAYWTSSYAPEMEAISRQVAVLRRHFPRSIAWGMNRQRRLQLSWRRGVIVSPRLWPAFRGATAVLQRAFQLNHIVGGLGDWFYLRAATNRPIVLTAAVRSGACSSAMLQKVDEFIVEWESDVSELESLGIKRDVIRVIPPPVDHERFAPSRAPEGAFSVLFASSPEAADQLVDRGVDAIVDAAARRPDYRFTLLWRPWGDALEAVQAMVRQRGVSNVEVMCHQAPNMERLYEAAHVTVAPFRSSATTKSVPNSLVESMASGRPVITTPVVAIGPDLARAGAGVCTDACGESLALALDDVRGRWADMSIAARRFSEAHFSEQGFIAAHCDVYRRLLGETRTLA
jgi:glycosyltransferase involved in cell wall biosynthesis